MTAVENAASAPERPVLSVKELTVRFRTPHGPVNAVTDLNVDVQPAEILGIVGESGSGKTTALLAIAGAVASNGDVSGTVRINGADVVRATPRQLRKIRQRELGFVFQNPMSSLNPVMRVGDQITERLRISTGLSRRAARREAQELLRKVGIPSPEKGMKAYPHQLSGGMCQRVMLAIALCVNPRVLLADEPTSALDNTTEQQVLALITRMCNERRTAVILVTHDLILAARHCTRIIVMYGGALVETGGPSILTRHPDHPYTRKLLASMAGPDTQPRSVLAAIPNPDDAEVVQGACRFAPRCSFAHPVCRELEPRLTQRQGNHLSRCFGTEETGGWISG